MGKVVFGHDIVLTTDIVDESRQMLAYNMLSYMMENGASFMVNGMEISSDTGQLEICSEADGEKQYTRPQPDPEWNEQASERDKLFTISGMSNDGTLFTGLMPLTNNYEKANEVNNFMLMGLDKSVSVSYMQDGEMKPVVANGRLIHGGISDEKGYVVSEHFERNWATAKVSESVTQMTQDLEEGLAELNTLEQQLEQ